MARHKKSSARAAADIFRQRIEDTSREWRFEQIKWKPDGSHIINFGRIYFPHITCDKRGRQVASPEFHAEIAADLAKHDRIAEAAPRGHAKTTLISLFMGLYFIVTKGTDLVPIEFQKRYIVLIEATQDMSEETLADMRSELEENDLLREDFGDLIGSGKWTQKALDCSNGVKVRARGAGTSMRGLVKRGIRPELILGNDIDGDDKAESRTECAKLKRWWDKAVTNLLGAEGGQIAIYGTILHWDALLPYVMKKPRYYNKIYKAVLEWDENDRIVKTLWPDYWTVERLEEVRADIGSRAFQQEYQNNPVDPETQSFKDEALQMIKFDHEVDETWPVWGAIDPAIGESKDNDYFVMLMARTGKDGKIWVFDGIRGRYPFTRQIEIPIEYARRHDFNKLGLESIAYQRSLAQMLTKRSQEEHVYIPIKQFGRKGESDKEREYNRMSKRDKIERLIPLIEDGTIRIHAKLKWLFEELETDPKSEHDDAKDCLQMLVRTIRPEGRGSSFVGAGVRFAGRDVMEVRK